MVVVFNSTTLGISEWNIAATDVVMYQNTPLFLTADGVVRLDLNAEVPGSFIETGSLRLAPDATCTITRANVVLSGDQAVTLRATVSGYGAASATDYSIPPPGNLGAESERNAVLGRGARGAYWTFRLTVASGTWALRSFGVAINRLFSTTK